MMDDMSSPQSDVEAAVTELERMVAELRSTGDPTERARAAIRAWEHSFSVVTPAIGRLRREAIRDMRYTHGIKLSETARLLGISQNRVCQIVK